MSSLVKTTWKINTVLVLQFHISSCKQRVEKKQRTVKLTKKKKKTKGNYKT